ncbi:MAG: energy transducer TonB [Saprospiraceae bacterium]|nr:energy transducer TonB [Saprospiraceae bacterium]
MKREKKDKNFIHKPIYPGGNEAFKSFVKAELKYPEEAVKNKIEGTVRVRYEIDYEGKVIKTRVISGIGYGCDEEAERIIRKLKFQVPKHRGVKVLFHKTTNIHFRLPKKKEMSLKYSYSSSEPNEKNRTENGYTYTVEF